MVPVNLVAVVVAAVASMVVGMLWYGPLFGKKWVELSGVRMSDIESKKSEMPKTYLIAFIGALVAAFVLAGFLKYAQAVTPVDGAVVGAMAWLGFVATVSLGNVLWEGKPVSLYLLNNGYNLVNFAVMGAVIVAVG